MPRRVCVEGNIGCGKSTAIEAAARLAGVPAFLEPVRLWGPLLDKFYRDQAHWALALSLRVLLSFREPEACEAPVALVERSPLACRHVFGQLLFNDSKLTQEEWDLFKDYCDVLGWKPDVIAYIHTPADECFERIRRRDRPEERAMDVQYVRRLEFQYETMLRFADVPVVRLDGTQPPEVIAQQLAALAAAS